MIGWDMAFYLMSEFIPTIIIVKLIQPFKERNNRNLSEVRKSSIQTTSDVNTFINTFAGSKRKSKEISLLTGTEIRNSFDITVSRKETPG